MSSFYVSIIFIGITLILLSLVWIGYDSKRAHDFIRQFDGKKDSLNTLMDDAEQMVTELNRFSDFVVTQMDLKNEELNRNLKIAEERMQMLHSRLEDIKQPERVDYVVNGTPVVYEKVAFKAAVNPQISPKPVVARVVDNVIPMNGRHREVLQLAQNGMSETDIAKKMRMGKGEIQLILGMNRN